MAGKNFSCEDLKIDLLSNEVETRIGSDLYYKYQEGIKKDLQQYFARYVKEKEGGNIERYQRHIGNDKLQDEMLDDYLSKGKSDYSALDIAKLEYIGVLPAELRSTDSLAAKVREVMNMPAYRKQVYIKQVQGGKAVRCINEKAVFEIFRCRDIQDLLSKQSAKAAKKT
ncbi:MAG: hypothetical protein NC319_05895 [Butyricicoccus sp.]|nr:hypothetical protein [Butyricicoccus sp.]